MEGWLTVTVLVGLLAGGGANVVRSLIYNLRYTMRLRRAVTARRAMLPEAPPALADGSPGEPIALLGRLSAMTSCEPFLPDTAVTTPKLGKVVLAAKELADRQDVRMGDELTLRVGDAEVQLLAAASDLSLVIGTYQTQAWETLASFGVPRTATYLTLSDGDEVWVTGELLREVDDTAPADGTYRSGPAMRYGLGGPLSVYATGAIDIRFRHLAASPFDFVCGVVAALVALRWMMGPI